MVLSWYFQGIIMVFAWYSHNNFLVFAWYYHGIFKVLSWYQHEVPYRDSGSLSIWEHAVIFTVFVVIVGCWRSFGTTGENIAPL